MPVSVLSKVPAKAGAAIMAAIKASPDTVFMDTALIAPIFTAFPPDRS